MGHSRVRAYEYVLPTRLYFSSSKSRQGVKIPAFLHKILWKRVDISMISEIISSNHKIFQKQSSENLRLIFRDTRIRFQTLERACRILECKRPQRRLGLHQDGSRFAKTPVANARLSFDKFHTSIKTGLKLNQLLKVKYNYCKFNTTAEPRNGFLIFSVEKFRVWKQLKTTVLCKLGL